jgi:hypothetical protein
MAASNLACLGVGAAATAGAFSPTDIAGLERWYKADALALATNDPVSSWTDSSGNAVHATQATSSKQPSFQAAVLNGMGVVRFDGTDDEMNAAVSADASRTLFYLVKQAATLGAVYIGGLASTAAIRTFSNQFEYISAEGGATPALGGTPTNWNVIAVKYTSTASAAVYIGTGTATNLDPNDSFSTSTTLTIGERSTNSGFWNGDFAEILVYDSALSDTDRESVRDYLIDKWAI